MTYDFHGAWETTTGHNAPFYATDGLNIEHTVETYLGYDIPRTNVILGSPLYGRAWNNVQPGSMGSDLPGYGQTGSKTYNGQFGGSIEDIKRIEELIKNGQTQPYYDVASKAMYVYSSASKNFISFESRGTTAAKAEYACEMGLGGMMFWDISNENFAAVNGLAASGLVQATRDVLYGQGNVQQFFDQDKTNGRLP